MVYQHARFIIYYKNGTTRIEDRDDPHCWDNAPKYEYCCQECGTLYPHYPEIEYTFTLCPQCLKNDQESELQRQTFIQALGIQFDPLPLEEDGNPILSKRGLPLRVQMPPWVLKGSSVYSYGFFQDKPAEQQVIISRRKRGQPKKQTFGIRIGMVVDPLGHCFCLVGYLAQGQPSAYSYYTTVHSLGIDEPALKLHSIKLKECGQKIVTKKGERIKQQVNFDLGERLEH